MKDSRFMLCLIPRSWILAFRTRLDFVESCDLQELCSYLDQTKPPGFILNRDTKVDRGQGLKLIFDAR